MKEQLISFDTAKLAKEKGFDWKVSLHYESNGNRFFDKVPCNFNNVELICSAPTQSLLQKWLREIHNIHIKVDDFLDDKTGIEWDYEIVIIGTDLDEKGNYKALIPYSIDDLNRNFKTYEQALEKGLQEALKLIEI